MGQSASLYRIDKNDINAVLEDPDGHLVEKKKEMVTFEKTFEGLLFILSKGHDADTVNLVYQAFYPLAGTGEDSDFEEPDIDNLPEHVAFDDDSISYNDPAAVEAIATFLASISNEKFEALFDAKELNENGVYPGNVWSEETGGDLSFNAAHMLEEFKALKTFYAKAKEEGDYVLSYVVI